MLKKKIIDLAKKNLVFRKVVRKMLYFTNEIKYLFYYYKYKVDDKTIFFEAYGGKNYACSPKTIYEYMVNNKKYKDYKFVWAFKDVDSHKHFFDKKTILVKHNSKDYYKYLSSSKYWIVNSLIDVSIKKKKAPSYEGGFTDCKISLYYNNSIKKEQKGVEVIWVNSSGGG